MELSKIEVNAGVPLENGSGLNTPDPVTSVKEEDPMSPSIEGITGESGQHRDPLPLFPESKDETYPIQEWDTAFQFPERPWEVIRDDQDIPTQLLESREDDESGQGQDTLFRFHEESTDDLDTLPQNQIESGRDQQKPPEYQSLSPDHMENEHIQEWDTSFRFPERYWDEVPEGPGNLLEIPAPEAGYNASGRSEDWNQILFWKEPQPGSSSEKMQDAPLHCSHESGNNFKPHPNTISLSPEAECDKSIQEWDTEFVLPERPWDEVIEGQDALIQIPETSGQDTDALFRFEGQSNPEQDTGYQIPEVSGKDQEVLSEPLWQSLGTLSVVGEEGREDLKETEEEEMTAQLRDLYENQRIRRQTIRRMGRVLAIVREELEETRRRDEAERGKLLSLSQDLQETTDLLRRATDIDKEHYEKTLKNTQRDLYELVSGKTTVTGCLSVMHKMRQYRKNALIAELLAANKYATLMNATESSLDYSRNLLNLLQPPTKQEKSAENSKGNDVASSGEKMKVMIKLDNIVLPSRENRINGRDADWPRFKICDKLSSGKDQSNGSGQGGSGWGVRTGRATGNSGARTGRRGCLKVSGSADKSKNSASTTLNDVTPDTSAARQSPGSVGRLSPSDNTVPRPLVIALPFTTEQQTRQEPVQTRSGTQSATIGATHHANPVNPPQSGLPSSVARGRVSRSTTTAASDFPALFTRGPVGGLAWASSGMTTAESEVVIQPEYSPAELGRLSHTAQQSSVTPEASMLGDSVRGFFWEHSSSATSHPNLPSNPSSRYVWRGLDGTVTPTTPWFLTSLSQRDPTQTGLAFSNPQSLPDETSHSTSHTSSSSSSSSSSPDSSQTSSAAVPAGSALGDLVPSTANNQL